MSIAAHLDQLINELVASKAARLADRGILEVRTDKVPDIIQAASQSGTRIEILGTKGDQVFVRPSRSRFKKFSQDPSGRVSTVLLPQDPVLLD